MGRLAFPNERGSSPTSWAEMLSYYSSIFPYPAIPPDYIKTQHCVEPGLPMKLNIAKHSAGMPCQDDWKTGGSQYCVQKDALGTLWGRSTASGDALGHSWDALETLWRSLGTLLGARGPLWGRSGALWERSGQLWERSGAFWDALGTL